MAVHRQMNYDYFNFDLEKAIEHSYRCHFKSFICNQEEYVLFDGKYRKVVK